MSSDHTLKGQWTKLTASSGIIAVIKESLLFRYIKGKEEILALCLIILAMPFAPVPLSVLLILATGFLFLVNGRLHGITRLPLFKQVLVFWLLLVFYSGFSVVPRQSLIVTLIFGVFIFFYFMCLLELNTSRKVYLAAVTYLTSVTLESLLGLYQNFISRPVLDPGWIDVKAFPTIIVRVFGTLDNPNIMAQYLVPAIILGAGLFAGIPRLRARSIFGIQIILIAFCLLFTYSRGGWLSLAVTALVFCFFYERRLLAVAALLFLAIFWLQPDVIINRLASVSNLQETSVISRFIVWQTAWSMFRDFWFSGVGPGTAAFREIYNQFYALSGFYPNHAHNFYIEMLAEIGLFGTCIFFWFLLSYFYYSVKNILTAPKNLEKIISVASLAGIFGYLGHGLTESSWYNFKLVFLFWFLIVLTMSSIRLNQKNLVPFRPLSVLHIISDSNIGGAGRHLLNILEYYDRSLQNIHVLCPAGSLIAAKCAEKGARVTEMARLAGDESFQIRGLFPRIIEIARLIKKYDIRIVHTHASFTGRLAARLAGVTCIFYTKHRLDELSSQRGFKDKLLNLANHLTCHRVIAVSEAVKENLLMQGVNPGKIEVIYNGIDTKEFCRRGATAHDEPRQYENKHHFIGLVARLEKEKGHRYLLEAAKIILSKIENIRFIIIGTGSLEKELKEYAHRLKIDQNIIFTGLRDDIPELLAKIDIVVLPSLNESFGLGLVEGMCLGKPCVASNIGGIKEIIEDGKNGLLAKPADPVDLAEKIIFLIKNPDEANRLGQEAALTVEEKFGAHEMVRKITNLYKECEQRSN